MKCRVCAREIDGFALVLAPPGLSSLTTPLDTETRVAICDACGHAQGPAPVELETFYARDYRISLQSDEFDQLYQFADGKPVFRTDRQLQILLDLVDIRDGMKVLDYGAAKAQSLQKLIAARPGISPHVFDVSDEYRASWQTFLEPENTASYELPAKWDGRFDLITSYFVIEHVENPVDHLNKLKSLLNVGGRIFVIVPNALENTGDLLVVDHVNHFTEDSLRSACTLAGLEIIATDSGNFVGATAVVARSAAGDTPPAAPSDQTLAELRVACAAWAKSAASLGATARKLAGMPVAIHGAGFYGAFAMQRMAGACDVVCVIDNNPFLQGGRSFGRPVIAQNALPDEVKTVIVALNPAIARRAVPGPEAYGRRNLEIIYL